MEMIINKIISWLLSIIMIFTPIGFVENDGKNDVGTDADTFSTQEVEEETLVEDEEVILNEEIEIINPSETVDMLPPEYEPVEDVEFSTASTPDAGIVLSGLGTEDSPYLIYDEDDLIAVALCSVEASLKSYYRLEADIELTADTWTPIGTTTSNPFAGVFDGNGHTISSTVLFQSTGMSGIFGVNTGTIKNLNVTVTIEEVATDTGALVATNSGRIENCFASGSITSTANKNIGGLVGYNTGVIMLSGSSVVVTASSSTVGGLVGKNHNGGVVQYSYSTGDVTGRWVGGLIGEQNTDNSSTVKTLNSYSMSKVVGSEIAGGLIGYNHTYRSNDYTYVEYCYARGLVTCSGSTGGLIGRVQSDNGGPNYIRFSYYNKANTGNKYGFGISVTNLKQQESFYGWNFDNVWSINADYNSGSPYINIRGEEECVISGTGTKLDPYIIENETHLFYLTAKKLNNAMSAYYELNDDITITANFWTPIGRYGDFTGNFDGNGYTISGINISNTDFDACGLFAYNSGTVQNVTVTATTIVGNTYTGAVVAFNRGTVSNCYVAETTLSNLSGSYVGGIVGYNNGLVSECGTDIDIESAGATVGGLAGKNHNGGVVQYSYATGDVTGRIVGGLIGEQNTDNSSTVKTLNSYSMSKVVGSEIAGGLIGYNHTYRTNDYTYVEYCYARGLVTCSGSSSGGLIGRVQSDNGGPNYIRFSYYNKANTGNKYGFSTTASNMKKEETFYGWNFENIWTIDITKNSGYPIIDLRGDVEVLTLEGTGDEDDPYLIHNEEELRLLVLDSGEYKLSIKNHYKLANDIEVTADHWTPIGGNCFSTFVGVFDGDGHTISGIKLSNNYYSNIGLFGVNSGTIKNLNVEAELEGVTNVGALLAYNSGTVTNCSSTGTITNAGSSQFAGGLVGYNNGKIELSSSSATVNGSDDTVGGLVGKNHNGGVVQYSYSTGDVTGRIVGGLIGEQNTDNSSTVKTLNSYSMSKVIGSEIAGGLIGYNHTYRTNDYTYVEYCYARGLVTCSGSSSGGLIGRVQSDNGGPNYIKYSYYNSYNTGNKYGFRVPVTAMFDQSTFYMWNFDNIWSISPDVNGGSPYIDLRGKVKEYELDGYGDEDDPYMIYTERDLWALVDGTYNLEAKLYYQLQNDIEITANYWTPIGGNNMKAFNGIFDGNGYTISGLNFSDCYYENVGFIGVNTGEIKNLNVVAIFEGVKNVGALCGTNSGTINNCSSTGLVTGVTSTQYAGGLIGYNTGKLNNAFSSATVNASNATVGGLVGKNHNGGVVQYSYATGDVLGRWVGGLIGEQNTDNSSTVKTLNSYSMSKVVGSEIAGGLIGYNHTYRSNDYTYVEYCYARSLVTCSGSSSGGLIGRIQSANGGPNTIISSYYDTTVSQLTDINRGTPLDSNAMKLQASYVGWDFADIWSINNNKNNGYPYLRAVEPESVVEVTGITLDCTQKTMQAGSHFYLTATVLPADAVNKTVIWSSDNTDVAYVIGGKVIAKAAGTATVTAKTADGAYIATCVVTVNDLVLTGISIKTNPNKVTYFVGDTLDTTGLTLIATYNDGSTQTVTGGFTYDISKLNTAGTQTVTVTYEGFTASFTVEVEEIAISSIAINTNPTKTTYFVGDTLNTAGLTIKVTYNNGSTEIISSGFTCTPQTLSVAGTRTVRVTYSGKSANFTVTVNDVSVSGVSIKTEPNKLVYNVGDTLNTAGLVLNVTYSNGTTATVTSGFTCTPTTLNAAGTQSITVTYNGYTDTFNVTVNEVAAATVTSISIKTLPTKVTYNVGDTLNTAGLVLNVTYSDGTKTTVTSGFTCTPTTFMSAGTKTVTVTYSGKTATFNITVNAVATDPDAPQFVVSSGKAKLGDTIDVTVSIVNNPGIIATAFGITYDNTKLKLVSVKDGGLIGTNKLVSGADLTAIPYKVLWEDSLATSNYTEDGTLITYTFEVLDTAEVGMTEVSIEIDYGSTFNYDIEDVFFETVSGSIELYDRTPGDANDDGIINLKDVAAIRRWLVGGFGVTINESNADVNADGIVNLKDIAFISRWLVGGFGVELL